MVELTRTKYIGRVDQRPPSIWDDTTKGYAIGDHWQYKGTVWTAIDVTANGAVWDKFTGVGTTPYEILGASAVKFAGGLMQLKQGYTGNAVDISCTIGGVTTTATITILSNGKFDAAKMGTYYHRRDAGTHVFATKLYNQDASGTDAIQLGSYNMPVIVWDNLLSQYTLSRMHRNDNGYLAIDTGTTFSSQDVGALVIGRCSGSSMDGGQSYQVSFGRYNSGTGPYLGLSCRSLTSAGGVGSVGSSGSSRSPTNKMLFDAQPSVFVYRSNSSREQWHVNNKVGTSSSARSSFTCGGAILGGLDIGAVENHSNMHVVGYVLSTAPSDAQIVQLKACSYPSVNAAPQIRNLITVIGDSRSTGVMSTYHALPAFLPESMSYPAIVSSVGQGSTTTVDMVTNVMTPISAGLYESTRTNILLLGPLGINDRTTYTPTQSLANLQTIAATFRAAGWKIITIAEMAATDPTLNAHASALHTLIVGTATRQLSTGIYTSDWSDRIVDVLTIGAVATPANSTFYNDGLHEDDMVQKAMCSLIGQAADQLLMAA